MGREPRVIQIIDQALADLSGQLQSSQLSPWQRAVLLGRRRELKASRWLMQQLFLGSKPSLRDRRYPSLPNLETTEDPPSRSATWEAILQQTSTTMMPDSWGDNPPNQAPDQAIVIANAPLTQSPQRLNGKQLQDLLFDLTTAKLNSPLDNLTATPLEIDMLRLDRKRELFCRILRQLEVILDELRFSQVPIAQLAAQQPVILRDLWQAVVMDFFGRYATLQIKGQSVGIVPTVLQSTPLIEAEFLAKLPLVEELLGYFLFQTPIEIDQVTYAPHSPEAIQRTADILENLLIQLACAVMQPFLNHFSSLDVVQQGFYDRRLLSVREMERFRNDLSWRYRLDRYVQEPKAIFESQHRLWVMRDYGLDRRVIYAARQQELANLAGLPLAMTLILETQDALAPRVKSAAALLGSGIVYLLTEVIGRGIGLIGRGILKGLGRSLKS